jgi:hypothetical protein
VKRLMFALDTAFVKTEKIKGKNKGIYSKHYTPKSMQSNVYIVKNTGSLFTCTCTIQIAI